eukprot:7050963-Prymnesium_polylepis.1
MVRSRLCDLTAVAVLIEPSWASLWCMVLGAASSTEDDSNHPQPTGSNCPLICGREACFGAFWGVWDACIKRNVKTSLRDPPSLVRTIKTMVSLPLTIGIVVLDIASLTIDNSIGHIVLWSARPWAVTRQRPPITPSCGTARLQLQELLDGDAGVGQVREVLAPASLSGGRHLAADKPTEIGKSSEGVAK